jgi:hypothetical protein
MRERIDENILLTVEKESYEKVPMEETLYVEAIEQMIIDPEQKFNWHKSDLVAELKDF